MTTYLQLKHFLNRNLNFVVENTVIFLEALAGSRVTFRFEKRRLGVLEMTHKSVGILLGSSVYRGIKRGKTDYENLQFYEEIGKELNIIPCFFRLKDIVPGVNKVKAYVKT